jgi:hypothetical protein
MQIRILAVGLALTALPATAQPGASQAAATPFRSAFAGYQAWREPEPLDWRNANRTAGDLGGHMGQVRGHARSDPAPANAPPSTSKPPPQSVPAPAQSGAAKP